MLLFYCGLHFSLFPVRKAVVIKLLRRVVVARQLLVLLLYGRTQRHPALEHLDLFLQPLLVARRLRNQLLILMDLHSQLADLRRFGQVLLLVRDTRRIRRGRVDLIQFLLHLGDIALGLDYIWIVFRVMRLQTDQL